MKTQFQVVHPHAAGLDIGSEKVFVAVEEQPVKQFSTYTESYQNLVQYLIESKVTTVAMEATGVYWIPLYEILEQAGIDPWLVNPSDVKRVPGRKSDVQDCQWILQLHTFGLLNRCYIPDDKIRILRSYVRLRDDHISMRASHILHMHKALDLMNIKLHNVISQIDGVSGRRIVDTILAGERDPEKMVQLCDKQILKRKRHQVLLSLKGNYRSEHIFALSQAVDCYDFYQKKIDECDFQIAQLLDEITRSMPKPNNTSKPKPTRHNQPDIDNLHTLLLTMASGNDASSISGLSDLSFLKLISETGTDLEKHWKSPKHFVSWLGLAPIKNSSGKSNRRSKKKFTTPAGQIFRLSARSVGKSKNYALGAFYRRISTKKGASVATKATARKIAVMYFNAITKGLQYVEHGIEQYNKQYQDTQLHILMKKAKQFHFHLVPVTTT
jgi:transposase